MTINTTGTDTPSFITSDLPLVVALSLFFPIRTVTWEEYPSKAYFAFAQDESGELEKHIRMFWDKELRVEPLQYYEQIKAIKNRLYANKYK